MVVGDWLRRLKLFWDLHIFQHVNKYLNEPETTLKELQNNPKKCFVSHVRVSETKRCFRFVLKLFCVVLFHL